MDRVRQERIILSWVREIFVEFLFSKFFEPQVRYQNFGQKNEQDQCFPIQTEQGSSI